MIMASKLWQNRQAHKNPPVKKYEFTEKQLLEFVNKQIVADRKTTVNRLYAVFALSMHDLHDFKKKRLQRVLKRTAEHFDCVMSGHVSEEEIMAEVAKFDIFIK